MTTQVEARPFSDLLAEDTAAARQVFTNLPLFAAIGQGQIFSIETYKDFLAAAHCHVRMTTPLYAHILYRLADAPFALRKAMAYYIEEEFGHEQWIESDLAALGVEQPSEFVRRPIASAQAFTDYLRQVALDEPPLAMLGMSYILETQSVRLAHTAAKLLKAQHGLADSALSYLNTHGTLDVKHTAMLGKLLDSIDDEATRKAITRCAQRTCQLYGAMFQELFVREMAHRAKPSREARP